MNNFDDYGSYDPSAFGGADPTGGMLGIISGGFFIFYLAILALMVISMWKLFVKAGKPGWASIVPIYNTIVMLEIVGMPVWYIILLLVPFVNIVIGIMLMVKLAKVFGKSGGYAVGLIFLPLIFYPMLGFGKSQYVGAGAPAAPVAPAV